MPHTTDVYISLLSISQSNAADSQARMTHISRIKAELERLEFQESTLAQQIDQFQQACTSAKDKLSRMRSVNTHLLLNIH